MQNGVAVALPLDTPPSASSPAQAAAGKPAVTPGRAAASEIEQLGEVVADATIALCWATLSHRQAGVLDPAIKNAGASALARAAMLQLNHELGDDDFAQQARAAGRRALRQHFTADELQHHGSADVAAMINLCLDETLVVVGHVVRDERIFRATWAH